MFIDVSQLIIVRVMEAVSTSETSDSFFETALCSIAENAVVFILTVRT
jgi:hypothetical protein